MHFNGMAWWENKPEGYWWRMGAIGDMIASKSFIKTMEQKFGRIPEIVEGHPPLFTKVRPVANFDDEARHMDFVAVEKDKNLDYNVLAIAEVKSTVNKKKKEFKLNGLSPRYLKAAIEKGIPVYAIIVRFQSPLPDDIVDEKGATRAYMEHRETTIVEVHAPGTFEIVDDTLVLK